MLELTALPFCEARNPKPGFRPMPLAHLTYQRYWEANAAPVTLPDGTTIPSTAEQIARYFGFNGVAGYCASNP